MSSSNINQTDDAMRDLLHRLITSRGLDPAMKSPEALEEFIKNHKILRRGLEWRKLARAARNVSKSRKEYLHICNELLKEVDNDS